ncbi:MAG TPA: FtsW/RodA/SpoVE family cell cycle protein [Anaerohalosphaeraceae bacterium]|nr:FtsW/RodA/SpoVE family cell cycle protein [Anaerohalosphaeraceae bacterium]
MFWIIFQGRFFWMRLILLSTAGLLLTIGIITIYAIGHPQPDQSEIQAAIPDRNPDTQTPVSPADSPGTVRQEHPLADAWKKQLAYAASGLVLLVLVNLFNYQRLGPISYLLYGIVLAMLAVLLLDKFIDLPFVPYINGTRRWFRIGFGLQIQPSEFCKIAYILALAWYLRYRSNYRTFLGLVGPFALTLLAMVLILLEPDLGTVLLMMPILFSMLFVAGAKVRHLLLILCLGIAVSPLMWHFMKSYQRMRISGVLLQNETIFQAARSNPRLAAVLVGDPDKLRTWKRDEGYHLLHSKQAIASGGLRGYGFARGPYVQYSYLPERHNDFIFAMIAHQFGIAGGAVVLVLYIVLIACAIELAWLNTDPFGRLTAVGIAAMFAVEVLVNVCMTLGLMPITGLTLPLVSYGGSSLVVSLAAVGLLNNIGRHRPFSVAKKPFEFA